MIRKIYICLLLGLVWGTTSFAQKNDRDYLRSGNKLYQDSLFIKAEIDYRKALDVNPNSTEALYNLGNSLLMQQKGEEALEQWDKAAKVEMGKDVKNKSKLSKIYHNMGVLLQASKQYPLCIEAYKNALRNNPDDDETRYNLALAQKMLKEQPPQQNNQQNKDNENQQKEDKKENQKEEQKEQENKKEQQPEQQEQQKDEMSKENAEQLLNAIMQDEKEVQEKVKKQIKVQGKKFEKDW